MKYSPYVMTNWVDHIIDMEYGDVIQEGTRFTASRANNIEEGIFNLHGYIKWLYDDLTKLRIQLEMIGRVPVNNGTFFGPIGEEEGSKALDILKEKSVLQSMKIAGATSLDVEDSSMFKTGETITILDDENIEDVKISNILDNTLTVNALVNPYKKGAIVMRTNAIIKGNKLVYGNWGNYTISVREVS